MNIINCSCRFILSFVFLISYFTINAQEKALPPVQKQELKQLITKTGQLLEEYYLSLEMGKKMRQTIQTKFKNGSYNHLSNPKDLAEQLTNDLRLVSQDLHMEVYYNPPQSTTNKQKESKEISQKGFWTNYGFQEMKVLRGNIGYLKISHFTTWRYFKQAKKIISSALKVVENTDALIIDVRNNRGGFEDIVAYLISYFFDGKPIHLSDYYCRHDNNRSSTWTTDKIEGKKLPKIPLYVLVNKKTGSAAESFAYMLKHLKRATIVGETTAGAGNGASSHKASERFGLQVACQKTINAITKTSFEKVGVIPQVKIASKEAFSQAYLLALKRLKKKNPQNIPSSNYEEIIKRKFNK